MLQIALVVALGLTWGLRSHWICWTGQRKRTTLYPAHCALKHTQVHPPPLGHFLAIRIHLLFLPVISVPACPLRHFIYFVLLFWLHAFSKFLGLSLISSPVSFFGIQPVPLLAGPLGRDRPAIEAKKCFAIKMDDLLFIMFCFSASSSLKFILKKYIYWPPIIQELMLCNLGKSI